VHSKKEKSKRQTNWARGGEAHRAEAIVRRSSKSFLNGLKQSKSGCKSGLKTETQIHQIYLQQIGTQSVWVVDFGVLRAAASGPTLPRGSVKPFAAAHPG